MNYFSTASTDPHFNMAFDQACLECLLVDEPVFFLWQNRPSVIIGLNQNPAAEVNLPYLREKGIVLARRVTGGGAVYHDLQNLNYTITGRSRDLERDFPEYLSIVINALKALGVPAELTGRNDITVDGRKCSGFAKRVWRDRLMVHGTLMFNVDIEEMMRALSAPEGKLSAAGIASVRSRVANLNEYLPGTSDMAAFKAAMQEQMAGGGRELAIPPALLAAAREAAERKFGTWEWLYGRSPAASFSASRKFPCGTVEVRWSERHGRLESISWSGDFLGNLPADVLSPALIGRPVDRGAIIDALSASSVRVCDCFDGLQPPDIAALLTSNR